MASSVCILIHESEDIAPHPRNDTRYIIHDIAGVWRERGLRVEVARGVPDLVTADACVLHVDLTRVPSEYVAFARAHDVTVNAGIVDISKRAISDGLVRRGDGYDGPVIVKTDLNYGGVGEGRIARARGRMAKLANKISKNALPWSLRGVMDVLDYRVYEHPSRVPAAVWLNRRLVVERFWAEHHGGMYRLRTWVCFGQSGLVRYFGSNEPIVKSTNIRARSFEDQDDPLVLPASVRARRAELGVDYGKIDFVVCEDGEAHVFDINKTVTTRITDPERRRWQAELLADGAGF